MKKILAVLLLTLASVPAMAQWHGHGFRHHGYYGHYSGGSWVAPLIVGGIVGAVIANNRETVVVQPQPTVVYQQTPVYVQRQPVCTEWREIQNPDGVIYRERTCSQ